MPEPVLIALMSMIGGTVASLVAGAYLRRSNVDATTISSEAAVEAARLAAQPNLITSLTARIDKLDERLEERDRDLDAVRDELADVETELRRVIADRDGLVMYVLQLIAKLGPDAPPWPDSLAHLLRR